MNTPKVGRSKAAKARKSTITPAFCIRCGKQLTWFTYRNVWENGKIKGRECSSHAPDNVAKARKVFRCDQCEACMINGVFCHETGCPNSRKTWVEDRGWVLFIPCPVCGCPSEEGESCCNS